MSLLFDSLAARQRHEELIREAQNARIARKLAQANGNETLLSRMVKMLSRSSRPAENLGSTESPLHQRQLA